MQQYLYLLINDRKKRFLAASVKVFLYILSLIYGLVVRISSFIYQIKPYQLNCKVISIGNITLGGTGKTSLVEVLAKLLKDKGHRVAVLSRGYKRLATRFERMGNDKNLCGACPLGYWANPLRGGYAQNS